MSVGGSIPEWDGSGNKIYERANGSGTVLDPYRKVRDVNNVISTTPLFIRAFHRTDHTSTISIPTVKDDMVVNVADASSFIIGNLLTIWNVANARWYQGYIKSISENAVNVDTPVDFEFQVGDFVSCGSTDMSVDGSVTPQIFSLRSSDPGIPLTGLITRIMVQITTLTEPGWADFGDLAALANGLVLRKINSDYLNIFNVKSNSELAGIMYDLEPIDAIKFGVYGIKGRLTLTLIGSAVELEVGDDLQLIVQDNLSGLVSMRVNAEGVLKVAE